MGLPVVYSTGPEYPAAYTDPYVTQLNDRARVLWAKKNSVNSRRHPHRIAPEKRGSKHETL